VIELVAGRTDVVVLVFVIVFGHAPRLRELPRFENSRNVEMKD
jgi:hypothetical protein